MSQKEVCPICLDEIQTELVVRERSCGHMFHLGCERKWRERSRECAVCKQEDDGDHEDQHVQLFTNMAIGFTPNSRPESPPIEAFVQARRRTNFYRTWMDSPTIREFTFNRILEDNPQALYLLYRKTQLVDNGFFYIHSPDYLMCFYCGIILSDWDRSMVIHHRHQRESPDCGWAWRSVPAHWCIC